jgi:hypothetical protein
MRSSVMRTLALVFAFSCLARVASATSIPVGSLFLFDDGSQLAFFIQNLTGQNALAPDYPITTPLTITVTGLTATTSEGSLHLLGSAFTDDGSGDLNCTAVGDAGSGGCDFGAYQLTSAILTGTFSPLSGLPDLPSGFVGIESAFTATLLPSSGSTLADFDGVNIDATLVAADTGTPVPEPPTILLMEAGLLGLFARHKFPRISELLTRVRIRRA